MKNNNSIEIIKQELFNLQDLDYKKFHQKLIPNIKEENIIGIRVPLLRKLAKKIYKEKTKESLKFLNNLPHRYYEENNLHAFFIENIKDLDESLDFTEKFLPYIDNWATCDSFSPKIFKQYPDKIYNQIKIWLNSTNTYTVRFAIGLLLTNYLDKEFKKEMLELVAKVKSKEYYVNMMIAWYFATALAKQPDATTPFIENKLLSPWIHNKTIQKACESRRFSKETKDYFRTLKIK